MPERVQLSRRKGWRKPENTVVVARPSKWGNPYRAVTAADRPQAVSDFRSMLARAPMGNGQWGRVGESVYDTIRRELAGKNLACWCPLDQPCHADVLLEIANAS